jgi:hypothetical protein
MEDQINTLSEIWRNAAHSLSVRIEAPYILKNRNGLEILCVAYLPDFGGPKGMVIGLIVGPEYKVNPTLNLAAKSQGFYCSFINAAVYEQYQEDTFKEALADWGFFGNESLRPHWMIKPE